MITDSVLIAWSFIGGALLALVLMLRHLRAAHLSDGLVAELKADLKMKIDAYGSAVSSLGLKLGELSEKLQHLSNRMVR